MLIRNNSSHTKSRGKSKRAALSNDCTKNNKEPGFTGIKMSNLQPRSYYDDRLHKKTSAAVSLRSDPAARPRRRAAGAKLSAVSIAAARFHGNFDGARARELHQGRCREGDQQLLDLRRSAGQREGRSYYFQRRADLRDADPAEGAATAARDQREDRNIPRCSAGGADRRDGTSGRHE